MSKLVSVLCVGLAWSAVATGVEITHDPAAEPTQRALVVADYTVFVDPPTGFVFVKLPQGWKFVGAVEAADVGRLPANVVTTLLPVSARTAGAERAP